MYIQSEIKKKKSYLFFCIERKIIIEREIYVRFFSK